MIRRLGALLFAVGCANDGLPTDEAFGVVDPTGFPDAAVAEIAPSYGYYDGLRVEFYRVGAVDVDTNPDGDPSGARANPMYWFYRAGQNPAEHPLFAMEPDAERPGRYRLTDDSQAPIIDDLPAREEYTPYWEIVAVLVPSDYEPNQFKSYETLRAAVDDGLVTLDYTGTAVNCPVVDTETELAPGAAARDRAIPRLPLWFRRLRTYCYLFEQPGDLLGVSGYPMPAARVVVGTDGARAARDPEIARPVLSIPLMDLYYPRTPIIDFTSGKALEPIVWPNLTVTAALPGDDDYSPLTRALFVDLPGDYRSVDDIEIALTVRGDDEQFLNVPVRGTVSPCVADEDCDDGAQPRLTCNLDTSYCDVPPSGYGAPCGPGVGRCDHTEDDELFPMGLACTGLRVQTTRYCYRRCDWEAADDDASAERDSRCGGILGMTCVRTLRIVENDAGVCMTECNALAGTPDSATANRACEITDDDKEWDESLDGVIYDGSETAPYDLDDKPDPKEDGERLADDEEPDGRVDYLEGQTCVTSTRDLCAWPDSRVDEFAEQKKASNE